MDSIEWFYLSAIERRAAKQVYRKFGLNRYELNMLTCLCSYLLIHRKKIVSRKTFTDWLGLDYRSEKRCNGYITGCLTHGAMHRLSYRRPDGNCLAISGYGIKILQAFEQALKDEHDQHPTRDLVYKSIELDKSNLPDGYQLRHIGRVA